MHFLCLAMLPLDFNMSTTLDFYTEITVKYIFIGGLPVALGMLLCEIGTYMPIVVSTVNGGK
jgi:hypothetical protein